MRKIILQVSRKALALILTIELFSPALGAQERQPAPLLGFSEESAARERQLEQRFDSLLKPENLRDWMKRITARPHHLGSPYGKEVAEFIAAQFRSWGFQTEIEEFRVLFPTPKFRLLEMTAPEKFTARLAEPALPQDRTSGQNAEQLPAFNAYSADGDVTGQLVYVNYGIPADYEELERRGIDVKGKIVLARYGGSWRGIKPKVAAEKGAAGCIIYSDPRDDGYFQGDVYPQGAWRNEHGAQRGSVADMPIYSGDPLTPGVGATRDAKRLALKDAATLAKIPVLPVSYADALPLLRALSGPMAPPEWRGALAIPYHLGPGPATVHLKLEFNWDLKPAYDVIARLPGREWPDEWILRGNHHDAWVNGAEDPTSGQVALMEEARAVAELARTGWRPRRTIVYAAWDGEEQGLIGSTEWAETHEGELAAKAVAYINSDTNARGFLDMSGSHTLERFLNQLAHDVEDPQTGVSVWGRLRANRLTHGSPESRREVRDRADLRIAALGSGSDYTPFLQHLGIAAMSLGYGGEGGGGSYHSIYDSFDHFTRFVDPGFAYGVTQAKTTGRAVLRLANADYLPFEFTNFSETVGRYRDELIELTARLRREAEETNRLIDENSYKLAADPKETYVAPPRVEPVPFLNLAPLENALARLRRSADEYDAALRAATQDGKAIPVEKARALDAILMKAESALTHREGLPGRPWYRHLVYAPGQYTGYGVKTLPGPREAIELRHWSEAEQQIAIVAAVLMRFAEHVDRGTSLLK